MNDLEEKEGASGVAEAAVVREQGRKIGRRSRKSRRPKMSRRSGLAAERA